mgnify:FL=1
MSIEKHVIQLTAQDSVTPAFKDISKSAKDAGDDAEKAGKKGSRSAEDWGKAAGKVGLALGALTGIAIKLGADSEVVQTRLQQAIENTGASYDDLKDQIDGAANAALSLAFDDEDALDALTTITNATGDAQKAIEDLSLAEDIARGRNISLAAAANIVAAAEQGRFQALKRLGIQIDENATKEEVLAQLQERYAGQADAYADTTKASWERIGNTIENKLEDVGSALADFQGPLIAIGGASQLIGPVGDAFDALGGKAKLAQAASGALSLAMGPVGLVAAAGLAVGAILMFKDGADEAALSSADLDKAIENNTQSLLDNIDAWSRVGLLAQADQANNLFNNVITRGTDAQRVIDGIGDALTVINRDDYRFTFDRSNTVTLQEFNDAVKATGANITEADAAWIDSTFGNGDGALSWGELSDALDLYNNSLNLTSGEVAGLTENYQTLMSWARDSNYDGAEIIKELMALLNDPSLSETELADALADMVSRQEEYNVTLQESRDNASAATAEFDKLAASLRSMVEVNPAENLNLLKSVIVDYTSGLASSVSSTNDWITSLTTADEGVSTLDRLLAEHKITNEDYTTAKEAQLRIEDALARTQDASAVIQIKNADLLADQTEATAAYTESLAGLDEQQQLVALGYANSEEADRVNKILEAAAAYDQMGTAGQEAFTATTLAAAATDPVLAAMLFDLGLLTGTLDDPTSWQLNLDSAGATGSIQDVSDGLAALIEVLAEAYNLNVDVILEDSAFWQKYNSLPSSKTINVYTTSGSYGPDPYLDALGGTAKDVLDYAASGRVGRGNTIVGEHGPELVTLPYGSLVTPNHATRYRDSGSGGGLTINGPITVVANNPESFMRQMRSYETGMNRR